MMDQPGSAHLQVLFEDSLREYEKQTDIALAKHPLAEQFQQCDSAVSVSAILQEKVRSSSESRGRIIKSLNSVVSVLYSANVSLGLVRPKMLMWCFMSLIKLIL